MGVRSKIEEYFKFLMKEQSTTFFDQSILGFLDGAARLYGYFVQRRFQSYAAGRRPQVALPVKVISLGNITVGGTGKTPTACYLANLLTEQGYRVVLLNRGYRARLEKSVAVMSDGLQTYLSAEDGGDEPYLLAKRLPGVPIVIGKNRIAAGNFAVEHFAPDVLILDDAYQHWPIARDLDIVLIDAANPFGNGRLLPRGILREPLTHLDRADLFVLSKINLTTVDKISDIYATLRKYNHKAPVIECVHQARWCLSYRNWLENKKQSTTCWGAQGRKVITLSALGQPESFENTVQLAGYVLVDTIRYADHHYYKINEIATAIEKANKSGAVIITTEKDAVKFPVAYMQTQGDVPIYILGIEIEITKGQDVLKKICKEKLEA